MTSIIGFAELARDLPKGEEPAELDEYLEIIARNADRLRRLTGDLLLIGRLASHTLEMVVDRVDVPSLVQGAVAALQPQAVDKGVDLECSCEPGTALDGDAGRLGQLIDNLVSNAIKYTDEGGTVSVTAAPDDGAWRVAVRDTGMGIPEEEQHRLFEQFFRASNARARAIAGSGLGLAIAGGIARLHGGHIEVVSEVRTRLHLHGRPEGCRAPLEPGNPGARLAPRGAGVQSGGASRWPGATGQRCSRSRAMTLGRLTLRLTVGGLMMGHGLQKLKGSFGGPGLDATARSMGALGLHPARHQAWAAGLSETVGGH